MSLSVNRPPFHTLFLLIVLCATSQAQLQKLDLNGMVPYTYSYTAGIPDRFDRLAPVPGLVDQVTPPLPDKDAYYSGTQAPKYHWYKFTFRVPQSNRQDYTLLHILKSRYNTQVLINGWDAGTYMQCSTPIEVDLTPYLTKDGDNVLILRLGERSQLPKESALGYDREKFADIPGIWDAVYLSFGGPVRIMRTLPLPHLKEHRLEVKYLLENLSDHVERNMEYSLMRMGLVATLREKKSHKNIQTLRLDTILKCRGQLEVSLEFDWPDPHAWSPEDPFLYEVHTQVTAKGMVFQNYGNPESVAPPQNPGFNRVSDENVSTLGMRDFTSDGRWFYLNGVRYPLFGSTITLNRFFEDTLRKGLPWDTAWVRRLLVDIPKHLGWNYMRVSLGLLPRFWYDLADEHGLLFQNEWPMWNLRGRPQQYRKEYTDWVWSDGAHPSIVIWDALNEQNEPYIGNELIPELKRLDPTRLWDAGWTPLEHKDIEEIHWYPLAHGWWWTDSMAQAHRDKFVFGRLDEPYFGMKWFDDAKAPIILNEYGWLWQSRDATRSGIRTRGTFLPEDRVPRLKNYEYFTPAGKQLYASRDIYDYFPGRQASPHARRVFQAYMMGIEGEIMRSTGKIAGLASFTYLTNDPGYTGDWFADITKLTPTPALQVQYHTHRPFAAFLNVRDGRYLKKGVKVWKGGAQQSFDLLFVNESPEWKMGHLQLSLRGTDGRLVTRSREIKMAPFSRKEVSLSIRLPTTPGGYLLTSTLADTNASGEQPQKSRRFIRIGTRGDIQKWPEWDGR